MSKLDIIADVGKNRLCFTLAGVINKKGLGVFYTELRFCVPDLNAGFGVIADLSGCTVAFLNVVPTFKNIMNYLLSNGAGEMVGIISSNTLLDTQIKLAAVFQGYKPSFVSTFAEAEERLVTLNRRKALRLILYQQPVKYRKNGEEHAAFLHDISTSGCVIETSSPTLIVGDVLNVVIPLFQEENDQDLSDMIAEVVRVEADLFAVKFTNLDDDRKKIMWNLLVKVSKQEILFS